MCSSEIPRKCTPPLTNDGILVSSAQGPKTHRERLVAFYEKYNPDKLPTVDATLEKFKGKEGELFAKLEAKYVKAEPIPPPSGSGPRCFLDISFNGESRALQFHSPNSDSAT